MDKHLREDSMYDVDEDTAWKASGACVGMDIDIFFPGLGSSNKQAKEVCATCDVRQECLDYAMLHEEVDGVWGGVSAEERRRLLRSYRRAQRRT
jgi:WhiB family transcriptional regulator, redox-sensing transcriptional regulator